MNANLRGGCIVLCLTGVLGAGHAEAASELPQSRAWPASPFPPLQAPLGDVLRVLPRQALQLPAPPVPSDCAVPLLKLVPVVPAPQSTDDEQSLPSPSPPVIFWAKQIKPLK